MISGRGCFCGTYVWRQLRLEASGGVICCCTSRLERCGHVDRSVAASHLSEQLQVHLMRISDQTAAWCRWYVQKMRRSVSMLEQTTARLSATRCESERCDRVCRFFHRLLSFLSVLSIRPLSDSEVTSLAGMIDPDQCWRTPSGAITIDRQPLGGIGVCVSLPNHWRITNDNDHPW